MGRSKRITPELIETAKALNRKAVIGSIRATQYSGRFEYCVWGLTEDEVLKTAAFIKALRPLPQEV